MLNKHDTTVPAVEILDRTPVFPFHNPDTAPSPTGIYPVRASTSAMLTVVVPELANNAPEHVELLRNPQGLWTVLAVNVPPGLGVDQGAHEHLTPISQYFRAISAAIITARIHQQAILTALKDKLRSQEGGSLIDDEEFTRSNLYHWSVRTCDELQTQNAATLKFLRHTIITHITRLHLEAHSSEKKGVDHWRARLDEEIFQLDDLQSQILALKTQVQEDVSDQSSLFFLATANMYQRNAVSAVSSHHCHLLKMSLQMHQVMSVMETRAALQASERTKTLSYLATLYLPLSASAVSSHQHIRWPILTLGEVNLQYECSPIINHSVFVLHRTSRFSPHHNHARSLSPAYAFYLDRIDRSSAETCHGDNREDYKSDCGCHVFQRHR